MISLNNLVKIWYSWGRDWVSGVGTRISSGYKFNLLAVHKCFVNIIGVESSAKKYGCFQQRTLWPLYQYCCYRLGIIEWLVPLMIMHEPSSVLYIFIFYSRSSSNRCNNVRIFLIKSLSRSILLSSKKKRWLEMRPLCPRHWFLNACW